MVQVIEFFRHTYPNNMTFTREVDEWRAYLGRFGISGRLQVRLKAIYCASASMYRYMMHIPVCWGSRSSDRACQELSDHTDKLAAQDYCAGLLVGHKTGGIIILKHALKPCIAVVFQIILMSTRRLLMSSAAVL